MAWEGEKRIGRVRDVPTIINFAKYFFTAAITAAAADRLGTRK